jgi:siroheme synthase (precorrin-2 oxidase/ferrochelatase)
MNAVPRRSRIDLMIPAELAIRDALIAVEALGAHPKLTEVVSMLSDAQFKIADWHDGGRPGGVPE